MPSYKLYYFNLKGRAELIRLLFAYAGVEYEDVRIPFTDWPEKKNTFPFKQLPVLEVDGKRYCQSFAIVRYLAREFGLAGSTSEVFAKADEFAEACNDVMAKLPITEADEKRKEELMDIALTETVPPMLQVLEENIHGDYYAGEITYADILLAYGADFLVDIKSDLLDNLPKLKALRDRVMMIPNIAKYIENRPKTD